MSFTFMLLLSVNELNVIAEEHVFWNRFNRATRCVLLKKVFLKTSLNSQKTPVPEPLFNKVAGLRPQNFVKFFNTFFTEHLWTTASVFRNLLNQTFIKRNVQFVQKMTFESLMDFKQNHYGNITKTATFKSFLHLTYHLLLFTSMKAF